MVFPRSSTSLVGFGLTLYLHAREELFHACTNDQNARDVRSPFVVIPPEVLLLHVSPLAPWGGTVVSLVDTGSASPRLYDMSYKISSLPNNRASDSLDVS